MIDKWMEKILSDLELTMPDRHETKIDALAEWIVNEYQSKRKVRVNFICTHNSRRSQFAQVWFKLAQIHTGLDLADSYSGGTEVTACNLRTIASLRRAGLHIKAPENELSNPVYEVYDDKQTEPVLKLWSKRFDDPANPSTDFAAVMTCDDADQNCPFVPGASIRVPLTYKDPKYADDTDEEEQAYDHTCKIMATDMTRLFIKVKQRLT